MNVVDRVKQHQDLQRKYPQLSPDDIELMIINGMLRDGFLMLFLVSLVIFVGILLK